ncbi:DUF3021 domain-containing protein [Lacticaseibacillus paracasei]|uniref:DUF3021 domain-containing protein n=1 Tax=Lacticaseibacillus paracasei TaxID=1597 RepID=UPI0002974284|nr:DUF3021 domain-containing protein [Lacticaseibacillus paracasei]EKQ24346.1 hypothetical protein LCAUW1_0611 [Lacticaseibacillus paracasei]RND54326.1 hypothetical protein FAM18121_00596 [Lacticaseibacillus paracasei]
MRIAKQLLTEAVIGIMIGATIYLTTLMLHLDTINPTPRSIAGLFIMSAVIGILSSIFDLDWLSLPVAYGTHFISTFLIVLATNYLMGWQFLIGSALTSFIISFIVIYAFIWIALYLSWRVTARKMTRILKKRLKK